MAVPSITSVTPSSGPTGGSLLVEIAGAGFRPPDPPPATGPVPASILTVRVVVGAQPARAVRVIAADRLSCVLPAADAGPVDVTVQNLDAAGAPIPGEETTLVGGFTFILERLTPESDLARLVRTLIREL